jgi:tripartite-type tricarboxylate transporter receptor subunit TctC
VLRGEVNFSDESVDAVVFELKEYVQNGSVIPLVQSGLPRDGRMVRDPRLPNIPTSTEALVAVKGEVVRKTVEYRALMIADTMIAFGRCIFLPPGVGTEVGETLRAAIANLNSDPDFQSAGTRMLGGSKIELSSGAAAEKLAQELASNVTTDQEARTYLDALAGVRSK